MDGWANLGAAFGGDSEKSYQEGLALGAKTEDALAQARERVEKNAARARLATDLRAMGMKENDANAASTALTAGGGITDPIQAMLKGQEFDFRAKAGDPNVPLDEGQRALLGVASGPVEPIYKVGNRAFSKFDTPENVDDLGAVFGGDGGSSAFIQNAGAFGLIGPDGQITNKALAYEILRNTDKLFDVGGVPTIRSGNPFAASPMAPAAGSPPQGPLAAGPTPAASAPPAAPLASVDQVARNKGTIAAATEQGQAQGRNAAGLESTMQSINDFEKAVDGFLTMPGYKGLYGNWQGTEAGKAVGGLLDADIADARGAHNTLGGKAFLASIQRMRGFGQLSNQEGAKVETALTRALDTRLSEDESKRAWEEVKLTLQELKRVAAIEAGQGMRPAAPAAPAAPTGGQPVGAVKMLGGKKYVKTAQGWMEDDGT